jgi:hypothetical protein
MVLTLIDIFDIFKLSKKEPDMFALLELLLFLFVAFLILRQFYEHIWNN